MDERLARRTDLYLTTHNTQKRQTSISPVGFEPAIPEGERPQGHRDRMLPFQDLKFSSIWCSNLTENFNGISMFIHIWDNLLLQDMILF